MSFEEMLTFWGVTGKLAYYIHGRKIKVRLSKDFSGYITYKVKDGEYILQRLAIYSEIDDTNYSIKDSELGGFTTTDLLNVLQGYL